MPAGNMGDTGTSDGHRLGRITPSSPAQVGPSGGADDLSPEGGNVT
jgi:hypothetical protein